MKTFILIFVLLVTTCLYSIIINVPADQPTIQAGIDVAANTDTVLVQPGTYFENINYNGNNITVASQFLTTQDTTYISQTIIDGNQSGSVVTIESGEDSTAVLCGFTITNGHAICGGGIYCLSGAIITNNTITGNHAGERSGYGGGIYCGGNVIVTNNNITDNCAISNGGGIYCWGDVSIINNTISENSRGGGILYWDSNSSLSLENVTISDNIGNGFSCAFSNPSLENVTITNNTGSGVYCYSSNPTLTNVTISGNHASKGGGIYCNESSLSLENVTISGNTALEKGGGIYCEDSILYLDPVDRCNIFLNFAVSGCDLYAEDCNTIDVVVDTFTVMEPDDYFAYPIDNFTFDILNAKMERVDQNLYVSPDGSDENSGLTNDDPLLTISYALAKIIPNSTIPHAIHLSNGIYSPSETGETFPLFCRSYVSLLGDDEFSTILDAEGLSEIIFCDNENDFSIENMTIKNGSYGIYYNNSSPNLVNVKILDNNNGAIRCFESSPILTNVIINGNGGGIYCINSSPSLQNVTISGNSANYNGGIWCRNNSNPELVNCILWNDSPEEINFSQYSDPNSITISYSDIQGGETGIVTNNNGTVNWMEGNIDEDPLFVGTGDHPFMLQDLSPCVNAGIPDTTGLSLTEFDLAGNPRIYGGRIEMGAYENQNVIVNADENLIPLITKLNQNYPNPFNPTTTINYSLKQNSKVSLNIYNIKGQKVKQLVSDQLSAGQHSVIWNGKNDNGKSVSSGIYFYKFKAGYYQKVKKMILMK